MSKNEFQHVRSGEPVIIPAATYNAMLDAAEAHRNRKMNLSQSEIGFDSLYIHVENSTGKFLERFDVVGLDGPMETQNLDLFCNRIGFRGVVPRKEHVNRFAIIQEDAAPNMVVRAVISGPSIAKINVHKPQQEIIGLTCSAVAGRTSNLELGGGGAAVLWIDAGVGGRWAIVHLGASTLSAHTGKVSREIKAGIDPANADHGGEVDEDNGEKGQRAFAGILEDEDRIRVDTRVEWFKVGGINRIVNAKCDKRKNA